MKIFRCLRAPHEPFVESPGFLLYPDSAVIRDGKPFFVPSFSDRWVYRLGLAWRVCRLGKTIGKRFADRYYDAVSLCLFPTPEDLPKEYGDVATSFDGAVILGEWLPLPPTDEPILCKAGPFDIDFGRDGESLESIIPWISRYCTLKIGDIIVSSVGPQMLEYPLDSRVDASIGGRVCLDFRIK